ncbi:ABC transporter permease [candidate division KSB1 bacterium]|nr:ABC transporter permease [candidate division KSB1 bacterium]
MPEQEYKATSMLRIILSQYFEHKFAVIGLIVLFCFAIIAVLAPWIGRLLGVDPTSQQIFNRYKPPMTHLEHSSDERETAIEAFIDANPARAQVVIASIRKAGLIAATVSDDDALYEVMNQARKDPTVVATLKTLEQAQVDQFAQLLKGFTTLHYLGTDELGRDVLMRLIYGTRVSMSIGLMVALISALIGLTIGSMAGFYGGILDSLLMRVTDSLLALPSIPVLILFAAADIKRIPILGLFIRGSNESIAKMVVVLCLFSWMTAARLVRASILSVKEKEFVLAAKTLGARDFRIIALHITPNILAPLLVSVTLNIGGAILSEAALSFLGLGVQPPIPTWGNMLFNAQELIHESPLLAIFPGVLIFITVICFNFVGDGLQDAIDPKAIRR